MDTAAVRATYRNSRDEGNILALCAEVDWLTETLARVQALAEEWGQVKVYQHNRDRLRAALVGPAPADPDERAVDTKCPECRRRLGHRIHCSQAGTDPVIVPDERYSPGGGMPWGFREVPALDESDAQSCDALLSGGEVCRCILPRGHKGPHACKHEKREEG